MFWSHPTDRRTLDLPALFSVASGFARGLEPVFGHGRVLAKLSNRFSRRAPRKNMAGLKHASGVLRRRRQPEAATTLLS